MIKVDLIKVGSNHLFRQFVGLTAQEWNPESGQHSNQRLRDSIRIAASTSIGRLYFAQGGSNHQEPMWERLMRRSRFTKTGRLVVSECTRSGKSLRSTTQSSSSPATE